MEYLRPFRPHSKGALAKAEPRPDRSGAVGAGADRSRTSARAGTGAGEETWQETSLGLACGQSVLVWPTREDDSKSERFWGLTSF